MLDTKGKMKSLEKLQHIFLLFALHQLMISSICQGCHIERVECDYEYVHVEGDHGDIDYPELEVRHTNCRVVGSRHRRSSSDPLFDFFNSCMGEKMPEMRLFMPSLVDFMMHHTTWYRRTEKIYCRSDTVKCWKSLCGFFLRWESKYIKPVKKCIEEFGESRGRNISTDKLKKPHITMPSDRSGQLLDEEAFLSALKNSFAEDEEWNELYWRELIQFYQEDYICSYNFCNCTGLPLKEDEKCGDNWLTRLVGSAHITSKYRKPLVEAASEVMNKASQRRRRLLTVTLFLRKLILFGLSKRNNDTGHIKRP